MNKSVELLKNLVPGRGYFESSVEKGVEALRPYASDLESIHILIDHSASSKVKKQVRFLRSSLRGKESI